MGDLNAKVGNVTTLISLVIMALENKMKEVKDLLNSVMKTTW